MRKLMMAVMAVAGIGLVTGCRDSVQSERKDVAEARQDVQQEQTEMQRELAGERQEGQEEIAEERQDVREEREELAEEMQEGMGGGAMAGAQTVSGRIQSATPDTVVLIVPEQNNQQMRMRADQQTQVKKDDKTVSLQELKPGDEVRASYEMGQNGQMILRSVEVRKKADDTMVK